MTKQEYSKLSNSELKLKLKETEDEFEALKVEVGSKLERMGELDSRYNLIKEVLTKRTKGFVV